MLMVKKVFRCKEQGSECGNTSTCTITPIFFDSIVDNGINFYTIQRRVREQCRCGNMFFSPAEGPRFPHGSLGPLFLYIERCQV